MINIKKLVALFLLQAALLGGASAMKGDFENTEAMKNKAVNDLWLQLQQKGSFDSKLGFLQTISSSEVREALLLLWVKGLNASNKLLREQAEYSQAMINGHPFISGHGLI